MPFSATLFPTENFCAGVSEIYGTCDLLSLDASCCTWHTWVFVIPMEEEGISLLNGLSGSRRGVYPITGLDYWTGPLDWTTGLKFYGEISKFLHTTTVS